jgi:hypothetical protein
MQSNLVNRKRPEADVLARLGSLLFMKSISLLMCKCFRAVRSITIFVLHVRGRNIRLSFLCIFGFSKGKGDASVVLTLNVQPSTISFAVHISDS